MPEDRNLPEAAEALKVVGMTEEEARLYLHLLQSGPSKVGTLAPYFDASRSKLYRLLDDLSRKGFVSKTPTRPTVYHPVFPEDAFEIGREKLDRRQELLDAVREEMLGLLRRLHRGTEAIPATTWDKIEGDGRIYEVIQRVIGDAQRSVWVASNHRVPRSPWLPFVREAWTEAKLQIEAGVEGRFVFGPESSELDHVPEWVFEKEDRVRVVEIDRPVHFLVADEEVVVFMVQMDLGGSSGQGSVAVCTDTEGPVGAHVLLFKRLWEEAFAPDRG